MNNLDQEKILALVINTYRNEELLGMSMLIAFSDIWTNMFDMLILVEY